MGSDRESFIRGSKVLRPFSRQTGLPLDHLNYIFAQCIAIGLSVWFRKMFNRRIAPTWMRHLVAIITGCWLSLFCFGIVETLQLVGVTFVSYFLMVTMPGKYMHHTLLVFCMGYLSFNNIKLLVLRNPDDYILDFSGPLMVMVQKITALAYSVYDGRLPTEDRAKLTRHRKAHQITQTPTFLEFVSYNLNFFGILSGPFCFFDDFKTYMENDTGETRMRKLVSKKIAIAVSALATNMFLTKFFLWRNLAKPEFYSTMGLPSLVVYASLCMIAQRCSFHFAWVLSDALNNSAGFGFNKKTGEWDLVTNVRTVGCEFADNPQDQVRNWNIQTTYWLRVVCYERAPKKLATFLTFGLSAMWHGFFMGYYFLFSFGHFATIAHRKISKRVTPIITEGGSKFTQSMYRIIGAVLYHTSFNYAGLGIMLLSFERLTVFTKGLWFYGHVMLMLALLVPTRVMQRMASLVVHGKVDHDAIKRAVEQKSQ